ncbi:hypothetical protein BKA56DRAFT_720746, partial [Ilyonectria sp. MPI-CAGE-AT-0026]
ERWLESIAGDDDDNFDHDKTPGASSRVCAPPDRGGSGPAFSLPARPLFRQTPSLSSSSVGPLAPAPQVPSSARRSSSLENPCASSRLRMTRPSSFPPTSSPHTIRLWTSPSTERASSPHMSSPTLEARTARAWSRAAGSVKSTRSTTKPVIRQHPPPPPGTWPSLRLSATSRRRRIRVKLKKLPRPRGISRSTAPS